MDICTNPFEKKLPLPYHNVPNKYTCTLICLKQFFEACMAIAGYAERQNRHALKCLPVIPKSGSNK